MNFERLNIAAQYSKAYKRKKLRTRIVAGLAAVVIFITTYALILPAATKERATFCGYTEHSHTEKCLSANCTLTEHSHSESCYINFSTDFETASDWESTLPKTLSGRWAEDILAVAQSQLGYRESGSNVATADEATADETFGGYTRYGEWYGTPYADWASLFASFCLNYAGVDKDYFPYCADNAEWVEMLAEKRLLRSADSVPDKGDIIFFRKGNGVDSKVGIVASLIYDGDKPVRVKVIEGDSADRVRYVEYSVTDESIYGYGDVSAAYDEFYKYQPRVKVYSDESVAVKATYPPSAGIPDGAELAVRVIDRESSPEEFESRYQEAFEKIDNANGSIKNTEITGFRLYDIHFVYNGEEIQPAESVDIQISYPVTAYSKTAEISVVHYATGGTEMPKTEHTIDDAGNIIADFETDSFSLFAVVTSETNVKSIVALSKITASTSRLTSAAYAVINGDYALGVDDELKVVAAKVKTENSILSADESLVRWSFQKSGSGYYITTTVDGTKYYLQLSGGAFALSATGTLFTVSVTSGNITVRNGSNYMNLSSNGVTSGTSMAMGLYALPTGSFTATFDGKIGSAIYMDTSNVKFGNATVIERTTDADGYIVLPTVEEALATEPGNYPLTLNGWYDIINSVYYDSSMFGAKIKLTCDTIFYPEWIPVTYDIGQNKGVITGQPDTSGFINTYVFDYNELFNVHSSNYNASDDKWYFDPESELGFIFFDYICHKDWGNNWSNTGGNIGYIAEKDQPVGDDGVTVNAEKTEGSRGSSVTFPGTITEGIANEARLNALFGTDPIVGRVSLGEGDWLYNYDAETGYYYYNSAKNAASYNQSEQRFYVYDHTVNIQTPSNNSVNDFLPFNYGDPADYTDGKVQFAEKDNEANYWYGMKSEITFYLPDDTGEGGNKAANGIDDMQFRFSGDDDVWVFVDDVLVLDLGGVHDMVYGEINFSTGKVRRGQATSEDNVAVNAADSYTEMPGLSGTEGVDTADLIKLEGGKEHKLTVYYLERGSSLSNCAVYFNLSPLYQLNLTKKDSESGDLLAGATFQAFADEACTEEAVLYTKLADGTLQPNEDSTFTTDENGIATCWGLFAGKTYYIKEIHAPPGYSNMSEYVIEFSLSNDGESVFVMIDSNGTGWEFAGAYHYLGGEDHLIELDVYNQKYIGGGGRFYVEKVWEDGTETVQDEITVHLYANGLETGRSIVLNSENGWKGTFYELPLTDESNTEIVYTVKEELVSGYIDTYEKITHTEEIVKEETVIIPVEGYWKQVSSVSDGKIYQFRYNTNSALAVSGTSLAMATLSETNEYQQWLASSSGTSFTFANVGSASAGTTRYLYIGTSASASTESRALVYSNNRLSYGSGSSLRYLRYRNNAFSTSRTNYTEFTAYEWVEPTTREETTTITTTLTYNGYIIKNTPGQKKVSIPVNKLWDETVSSANKQAVVMNLYRVTVGAEDSPEFVSSITLGTENGWQGSFEDVEYPEDGSYYAVLEDTDKFSASYSGESVMITVDNKSRDAARVTIDESGTAVQVDITNSVLVLLPETGGAGEWLYPAFGILLIAISAVALLILRKKIRI